MKWVFFLFSLNCQCQISWNHDFWLSFIQSLSMIFAHVLHSSSVISSSVISSSVTLHLWPLHLCLYLSSMARYITLINSMVAQRLLPIGYSYGNRDCTFQYEWIPWLDIIHFLWDRVWDWISFQCSCMPWMKIWYTSLYFFLLTVW